MKVYIYSLNSCGMRNVVVQKYCDFLIANGHELVDSLADSEIALIWTCGFRQDVRDNSLSEIRRMLQIYKGEVLVAGCIPDIDGESLSKYFHGRVIPWRNDEHEMEKFFGTPVKKLSEIPLILSKDALYDDEAKFREEHPDKDAPYIGRYTQIFISEGCKWECTYCSERFAFPPYRSFSENDIIETCYRALKLSGRIAVSLLGDSTGDYGSDTGSSLPLLIRKLKAKIPEIKIDIQDFNPYHFLKFYDDMVDLIKTGVIVHMQIPYQSASDHILSLMKRPYNSEDLEKVFNTINELNFNEYDSHMIVGFPGETEEDFELSVQFAVRHRPKYMLVNSFMEISKMPAADLPNKVSPETKKRRIHEAMSRFRAAKIICNSDYSDLACERFRRMNIPLLPQGECHEQP